MNRNKSCKQNFTDFKSDLKTSFTSLINHRCWFPDRYLSCERPCSRRTRTSWSSTCSSAASCRTTVSLWAMLTSDTGTSISSSTSSPPPGSTEAQQWQTSVSRSENVSAHEFDSTPTWSDLYGGRGGAGATLSVSHLQLEHIGSLDQVGQVEGGLRVGAIQNVLETQEDEFMKSKNRNLP